MPIDYCIDHPRRLVIAQGRGTLTDDDVFGYQRSVWSRRDVAGYDELIDMSLVTRIDLPSCERVPELAQLSAAMDAPDKETKLALVAPKDLAFGLGRMYQAHRSMESANLKQVGVFRSLPEALRFLGVNGEICVPGGDSRQTDGKEKAP
jgi:hypothetical protein